MVRFADSFGLDLEKVKVFSNTSFEKAFSATSTSDYDQETATQLETSSWSSNGTFSKPFLVLIPLFSLRKSPPNDSSTLIKLDEYVYDYENKIIKCIIKVKNVSFEKRVYARISFNSWKSFYDLDAIYMRSETSPRVSYDYFGFCILIPEKSAVANNASSENSTGVAQRPLDDCNLRIEFALCYQINGATCHWDNNGGDNYKFQCFFNKNN